jgi:hypothetical protein
MPEPGSERTRYRPRLAALGLRGHLVLLVLAVLLPALAFGTAASWDALRSRNAAAEARLIDTAQAMSAAIDAHIAGHIAALTVLAAYPQADEAAFADLARNTGTAFGGWVVVMDRDGRPLLNTHPRAGSLPGSGGAIGPGGGGRWVEQVFATGRPVVSDLATGRASGETVAFVFAPMLRDGLVWRGGHAAAAGAPVRPAGAARGIRAGRGRADRWKRHHRGAFACRGTAGGPGSAAAGGGCRAWPNRHPAWPQPAGWRGAPYRVPPPG